MNCEECLPLIDLYFDEELGAETARRVAEHLDSCASCQSALEGLSHEQELYLRYEAAPVDEHAFWSAVVSRVSQEGSTRSTPFFARLVEQLKSLIGAFSAPRLSPTLTALLVLFAIGITAGVMRYLHNRDDIAISKNGDASVIASAPQSNTDPAPKEKGNTTSHSNPLKNNSALEQAANKKPEKRSGPPLMAAQNLRRAVQTPEDARKEITPDQLVREAEQKYVAAIAMLTRDVNRRRTRLDPETRARFEQTLAAVDRTIAGTRRAVRSHPDDPVAVQYMLTAYAKKVEVLREMVSIE